MLFSEYALVGPRERNVFILSHVYVRLLSLSLFRPVKIIEAPGNCDSRKISGSREDSKNKHDNDGDAKNC